MIRIEASVGKRVRDTTENVKSDRGFTLVEIIVVVAIIAAASAIAMPSMKRGLSGMRLETKGRDLAMLCRAARTLAIAEQHVYRIAVERDKGSIALVDAYRQKVRDFDLSAEIKLDTVSFEGEEGRDPILYISFYPNGRSDEAEIVLKNEQGRKVILKTDVLTGMARVTVPRELR